MAILFAGGEAEDFALTGGVIIDTSGARHRAAYARQALYMPGPYTATNISQSFASSGTVNITGRFYANNTYSAGSPAVVLTIGGSARLRVRVAGSGGGNVNPATLVVESVTSGGVATTLGTSTLTVPNSVLCRMDLLVTYGVSGRVRLYIDQTLFIDFIGDVTASGATALDGFIVGGFNSTNSFFTAWSEIIVADEDTRPLSLKTLAPNAAGDTNAWTGAYTDIDETTASDTDVASSGTAGQVMNMDVTGMPAGASGLSVRAVKVVASALRGASGPSKLALGVKSGATEGWSTDKTLDTGYTSVSHTWTTNPATGQPFTAAELEALKLALKSVA